jgi:hypothetical protein
MYSASVWRADVPLLALYLEGELGANRYTFFFEGAIFLRRRNSMARRAPSVSPILTAASLGLNPVWTRDRNLRSLGVARLHRAARILRCLPVESSEKRSVSESPPWVGESFPWRSMRGRDCRNSRASSGMPTLQCGHVPPTISARWRTGHITLSVCLLIVARSTLSPAFVFLYARATSQSRHSPESSRRQGQPLSSSRPDPWPSFSEPDELGFHHLA